MQLLAADRARAADSNTSGWAADLSQVSFAKGSYIDILSAGGAFALGPGEETYQVYYCADAED